MKPAREHLASALLVGIAALGLVLTHQQRQASARSYSDAASYNRAMTSFLLAHREQLAERHVAVFGLSGLSPFSLATGRYLTRLLGAPSSWSVYVPRSDAFYPLGTQRGGIITVRPESFACELDAFAVFVVIDGDGGGRIAENCDAALQAAHPLPEIDQWTPTRVTPQMAAAGFDLAIIGRHLGSAVGLRIDGQPLAAVHATRGRLMTASVPPRSTPAATIAFTLEHRGRAAFTGRIEVGAAPRSETRGDAGGSEAIERNRAVRP